MLAPVVPEAMHSLRGAATFILEHVAAPNASARGVA
jgi:hypothetical protein